MKKVKHKNPFAMGNQEDLMYARENGDVEYLKEWSRKATSYYGSMRDIQIECWKTIININKNSELAVEKITKMLHDL